MPCSVVGKEGGEERKREEKRNEKKRVGSSISFFLFSIELVKEM